ncbi:MAG: sensor histidine kinase [Micromonosporaceae bacterium]|nr:sensor histidine kinase [Micromonosporaceae bacterium]
MWVLRWWRDLSQVERFDIYTRWSYYLLLAVGPVTIAAAFAHPQPTRPALVAIAGASVVQAVVGVAVVRAMLERRRIGGPAPWLRYAALAAVTVVGLALTWRELPHDAPNARLATVFFVVAFVGLLSLAVRFRQAMLALLGAMAVPVAIELTGLGATPPDTPRVLVTATITFIAGVSAIGGYRAGLWMLDVVWELDRARGVEARLAVAEERLRFARDLHDVVGRGLAVVSLKSDLAARLAQRGRPEAVDEMLEVRRVAQELLADVRDVVRGYRRTDLGAELVGARSVLASAGIECRIIGTSDAIGEQAQATLGWVVREGTTNVLRHSQATTCTISVQVHGESIELSMENDGASGGGTPVLGHGLIGLTERMAAAGGSLTAERLPGARFRLVARLPVSVGVAESGGANVPASSNANVPSSGGAGVSQAGREAGIGHADPGIEDGPAGRPAAEDRAEATVS